MYSHLHNSQCQSDAEKSQKHDTNKKPNIPEMSNKDPTS